MRNSRSILSIEKTEGQNLSIRDREREREKRERERGIQKVIINSLS